MKKNLSKQTKLKAIGIVWVIVTFLLGWTRWSLVTNTGTIDNIHSYWSIITIFPIMGLIYYRMHFLSHSSSKKESREYSHRQVVLLLGLLLALLTGLGTQMGFLPLLSHRIIVWPLALLFLWA